MNAIFCQMKIFKASPGAHRIISYDYKKIKEIKRIPRNKNRCTARISFSNVQSARKKFHSQQTYLASTMQLPLTR